MPVPWEALIPFGLLTVMFGAAGTFLKSSHRAQDNGKTPRYHLDRWEEMMMKRDERLTGHLRGQTDDPKAPATFATSSVWYTQSTSLIEDFIPRFSVNYCLIGNKWLWSEQSTTDLVRLGNLSTVNILEQYITPLPGVVPKSKSIFKV